MNTEVLKWLGEGLALERDAVYVGELKDEIVRAESTGAELPIVDLSTDYMRNVRKVSDRRFVAAGVRLRQLLK